MNNSFKEKMITHVLLFSLLVPLLAACASAVPAQLAPTDTPQPATASGMDAEAMQSGEIPVSGAPETTLILAGEPQESVRNLEDADGSLRAYEKRILSGDAFLDNRYERSFTQTDMLYLPDVDIQSVDITSDDDFFYFTITLNGVDPASGKFTAAYGIEFDRTLTGRGDLLVFASDPQPEWSSENLNVYSDKNNTVGGLRPMVAEAGMAGDGYESEVTLEGDKAAYARVSPDDATSVQIAVSRTLLDNAEKFLWGAWADKAIQDPAKFDYNDSFGFSEAGSPIKPSADYPLKALHSLDSTCRLPVGIGQTGTIPGMCKIGIPTPEPGEKGKTCVCLQWVFLGNTRACAVTQCS